MRCSCYCTAASYDIPRLFQSLQKMGSTQLFRDAIHIQIKDDKHIKSDIFYFPYGAFVCWGFTEEEEKELVQSLKEFEKEPNAKSELDEFTFTYGESVKIEEDE